VHHPPGLHFNFGPTCDSWLCWSYFTSNTSDIISATGEHVTLTVLSVLLGLLVAVPVAAFARTGPLRRGSVYAVTSAIYAIPSLAFIVAIYGVFGLGRLTVVIPLAAYSLVILVRNIITGLDEVPADAVDAARGMGFSPARLLWRVQLPLAVPTIFAGLRIAVVSTIELVVIGGYVSQGGYGDYLLRGLHDDYKAEVTTYLLLTVLLAVVADLLMLAAARPLTRWQRVAT
jgi:osmoprotectant transport system permease protein